MCILRCLLFVFTALFSALLCAQSVDPILMRIDNNTVIRKSDFEYAYKKNSQNNNERQSISNFLESYINFRLNVEDAKKQGMDKDESFTKEYSTYIEQVQKPYLSDSVSSILVARNIYAKLQENIEVSHILIKIPNGNILPKDTINPYKTTSYIQNEAVKKNGSTFESLAKEYSQDSITTYSSTPGYIGWKTAMSTPYQFEKAMYNTPKGNISEPIRTSMGYHLIKVHNRKPDRGQILIAHILLRYSQQYPTQQEKDSIANAAKEVYNKILAGGNFNKLCEEYSADIDSARKGGVLGWFGVNRPLPSLFDSTLFSMQEVGAITQPIETEYGYHIFKLLDKASLAPYDKIEEDLLKAISESDRKEELLQVKIKHLAEEFPYKVNEKTYSRLEQIANRYMLSDSTFFHETTPSEDNVLLSIGNSAYKVKDFIFYIEKYPRTDYTLSTDILSSKFDEFILDRLVEAQRNNLFSKYPEFRHLAQEYHDGILYFNVMTKEVWDKAQSDKSELQKLFDKNPQKYSWSSPKYKGYVIHAKNKEVIKKVQHLIEKNKGTDNLRQILIQSFNADSLQNIIVEKGLWAKGENAYVDRVVYNVENNNEIIDYPEFIIEGKLISSPENLNDAYGQVISDYQSIIEKKRIEKLRKEHKVEIDETVLKSIN